MKYVSQVYSHARLSSGEEANKNVFPGPLISIAYSFSPRGKAAHP